VVVGIQDASRHLISLGLTLARNQRIVTSYRPSSRSAIVTHRHVHLAIQRKDRKADSLIRTEQLIDQLAHKDSNFAARIEKRSHSIHLPLSE